MTDIDLHFTCAHYGLYGNAPVHACVGERTPVAAAAAAAAAVVVVVVVAEGGMGVGSAMLSRRVAFKNPFVTSTEVPPPPCPSTSQSRTEIPATLTNAASSSGVKEICDRRPPPSKWTDLARKYNLKRVKHE